MFPLRTHCCSCFYLENMSQRQSCSPMPQQPVLSALPSLTRKNDTFQETLCKCSSGCLSVWAANTHSHVLLGLVWDMTAPGWGGFNHCACTARNRPGATGCSRAGTAWGASEPLPHSAPLARAQSLLSPQQGLLSRHCSKLPRPREPVSTAEPLNPASTLELAVVAWCCVGLLI